MNKGRRHELKMLKYKKRLKNLGLNEGDGCFVKYRTTGKPCSCWCCQPEKMKVNGLKKKEYKEFMFQIDADMPEGADGFTIGNYIKTAC